MVKFFDNHGFSGSLGTNVDQEYFAEAKVATLFLKKVSLSRFQNKKQRLGVLAIFLKPMPSLPIKMTFCWALNDSECSSLFRQNKKRLHLLTAIP